MCVAENSEALVNGARGDHGVAIFDREDPMRTRSVTVVVTAQQRRVLEPLARARSAPQHLVERCRIVLMSAEGRENADQARALGVDRQRVRRWRRRWAGAQEAVTPIGMLRSWRLKART